MKKAFVLILSLLPALAFAECTPTPDCASIGYTETRCDGDSIKCPFDTTKLYCPPCDSSFRYTCTGDNIKNPIGKACNNKYAACECIAGATFTNDECICDISCDTIGNIYYSDGSCSSCKISDKTPVGIVAYKNANKHLIISLENNIKMPWSTAQTDAEGNTIIAYNKDLPGLTNYSNADLAKQDYNGFENTQIIVEAYGENATGVAAVYCYNYAPTGLESSKNQWYLPAFGEIYDIVYNNKVNIIKGFTSLEMNFLRLGAHWSSSETNYGHAWLMNFSYDTVANNNKSLYLAVSCLLAI